MHVSVILFDTYKLMPVLSFYKHRDIFFFSGLESHVDSVVSKVVSQETVARKQRLMQK